MLRITKLSNSAKIKSYYIERKPLELYYSENQEFNGYWGGNAAKRLGLKGYVTGQAFERLCDNLHPETGEQLTDRMREDRSKGRDVTFSCPKPVSTMWAFGGGDPILRAHRQAVADTMAEMEKAAAARVRAGLGKFADENRVTGNFAYAEFVHLTSRPVDGWPDMQIHSHVVLFNLTYDPVEKKWKALQEYLIHKEAAYYEKAYHMRLAESLRALGLQIVPNENAFDIVGIEHETNKKFSRRRKKIKEVEQSLRITDPEQKARLGLLTRERKNKNLTITELRPIWEGVLTPEEKKRFKGLAEIINARQAKMLNEPVAEMLHSMESEKDETGRTAKKLGEMRWGESPVLRRRISINRRTLPGPAIELNPEPTADDRRAVTLAMEHLFARKSVVSEKHLITEAFKNWRTNPEASREGIMKVVSEMPLIRIERDNRMMVTTWQVLAEENRLIDRCKRGKSRFEAINPSWRIQDTRLNCGQRDCLMHALTSADSIVGFAGQQGTGKTELLKELRQSVEASGRKFFVFAPGAELARDTLRHEGFPEAKTVAHLLRSNYTQERIRGQVVVIEEAGLLSTRDGDKVTALLERLDARLILIGDIGQHRPVERGQAFDLMLRYGEMCIETLDEVVRQRGNYKLYAQALAKGRIEESFELLEKMQALHEIHDPEERAKAVAARYLELTSHRKKTLVVCPTHAECRNVTEAIRNELRARNLLGNGVVRKVLKNLSWTDAQKCDWNHYKCGMIVQVNDHVQGFGLGERMEVVSVDEEQVLVAGPSSFKRLPLSHPQAFNVYEKDVIDVCEGDWLRFTSNGYGEDDHRFTNGSRYRVKKVKRNGTLILDNGWKVGPEWVHCSLGYAATSNSAQGKSVDWVLVAMSSQISGEIFDIRHLYVATTRGREGVEIYPQSIEWLKDSVSKERDHVMAKDLVTDAPTRRESEHDEFLNEQERQRAKDWQRSSESDFDEEQAQAMQM